MNDGIALTNEFIRTTPNAKKYLEDINSVLSQMKFVMPRPNFGDRQRKLLFFRQFMGLMGQLSASFKTDNNSYSIWTENKRHLGSKN
jgi:hypothetical protein